MGFSQLVPWKHESVGRVLSGHQLVKPTGKTDMRYVIRTAISHGHSKYQITTVGSYGCIIKNMINAANKIIN